MSEESFWNKYFKKLFCISEEAFTIKDIKTSIENSHHTYNGNKKMTVSEIQEIAKNITNLKNIQHLTCINFIEHRILRDYLIRGHLYINHYLYKDLILNLPSQAIPIIKKIIPQKGGEPENVYEKRIAYIYFVNLYNTIQKAPPLPITVPFIVYRGVNTPYMKKNKDVFYYIDSFSSTTQSKSMSHTFTNEHVYIYYVHPQCRYLPIPDEYSYTSYEREILFTPYHRYLFIKKEDIKGISYYHYVILPTDLVIPSSFEEFNIWKKEVFNKTSHTKGGRIVSNIHNSCTRKNKRMNHHIINTCRNKKGMGNIFRKLYGERLGHQFTPLPKTYQETHEEDYDSENENEILEPIKYSDVQNRFISPFGSFEGKTPTLHERKVIQSMLDYFGVKSETKGE